MTKAGRTRKFIIEISAPIINKKGMAGTSLTDIMEATKLAKGGIYGNFESKDEICTESFIYLSNKIGAQLDEAVSQGNSAKSKFFNLLEAYKNMSTEGGCPLLNFGVESDDTHPVIKERVGKRILNAQKRISTIINDGINNKEISGKLNPINFGIKVFAMIEGAILIRRVTSTDEQMDIILEAIKDEFNQYLL